jgi:hypothetical protein
MERAQTTGLLIIVVSVVELLLFLYGAARRSYLALALPVAAAMTTLAALGLWVGWTMMNLEDEAASEPPVTSTE